MQVPIASKRRNRPVSSLKMTADMVDQKNALRPKAAKGNAVAVPRCVGKFDAAKRFGAYVSFTASSFILDFWAVAD